MGASLRLFAAIGLPPQVRDSLARCLAAYAGGVPAVPGLRWLPPDNWHLTLQFFGHVEQDALGALGAACEQAAGSRARFELELGGAGAFSSTRRARVVWVGVQRGHELVAGLARALFARTEPLGFPREQREFRSHLTVARLKTAGDVRALLAALRVPPLNMAVTELTLYRSQPKRTGAEYEPLARYPLGLAADRS